MSTQMGLSSNHCDRGHDTTEITDEVLIKSCETMKTSNLKNVAEDEQIENSLNLRKVHIHTLG